MICELERAEFFAAATIRGGQARVAIAAVAGRNLDEVAVLESWARLKTCFDGLGVRLSYRAFIALVEGGEADVHRITAEFSQRGPAQAAWAWAIASVAETNDPMAVLEEIEWRAHKAQPGEIVRALNSIGGAGAL